ncbi:MAG: hypothetical protein JWO22_2914 [Frankiales bacterium]|nr:hypothetical protein [Frankiales bacterium]
MHVDRRSRSTSSLTRAARRVACVHRFDILGRSTAETVPDARSEDYGVQRLTSLEDLLRDADGEHDSRALDALKRIAPIRRALQARRARRQAARFAQGDVAYVATQDGAVAAWAWASQAATFHCRWSGLRFRLATDEAYLYDLWCFPAHRRTGAGVVVMRALMADLHSRGAARVYGYVLQDNRASQVLHRLVLGFEQVQVVSSLRVLSHWAWQLPRVGPQQSGPCTSRRGGGAARSLADGRRAA